MYYVVEGIDGCGKTTVISEIVRRMQSLNMTPISLHEPTYGPYGKEARSLISCSEYPPRRQLHALFTQDRQEHVQSKIKPALSFVSRNPSFLILQDRGYLSAPAYQAYDDADVWRLLEEQMAIAPQPDQFFLIDVDVAVAIERIRERADENSIFERKEMLDIVRKRYIMLAESGKAPIQVVDGSLSLAEIVDIIIESSGIVK